MIFLYWLFILYVIPTLVMLAFVKLDSSYLRYLPKSERRKLFTLAWIPGINIIIICLSPMIIFTEMEVGSKIERWFVEE